MDNLKGKRLLVLGGDRLSAEIVKKAKELGIYTIVTDWYSEDQSPAKKIADKSFLASTADIEAMVQLIRDEKVDGVLTGFTDSTLPYYARICEEAGLSCYGTKEQFEMLTNKKIYKGLCRDFDVPVVEDYEFTDGFDANKADAINYPVLVKPVDNSGARGISICKNKQELQEGYEKALEFSKSKEVLVERYIDGKEITVFYILQDGEIHLTALANRHIKQNQENVIALPVAYTFPSIQLENYREAAEPKVKAMFQSLGLKNGMVFMQCLVEDGECILYDMGFRLTGSLEYKLIEEACGYNPLEMLIRFSLTGQMAPYPLEQKVKPNWEKYAGNISFLIKPGIIGKIMGVENIVNIPGVHDAVLAHIEGDEIPIEAKGTLRQIILRVFATAPSQQQLEAIFKDILSSLTVETSEGENMLLDGLLSEDLKGAFA